MRPAEFVELRMDSAFPEGKGTSKEAGAQVEPVTCIPPLVYVAVAAWLPCDPVCCDNLQAKEDTFVAWLAFMISRYLNIFQHVAKCFLLHSAVSGTRRSPWTESRALTLA